MKQTIIDLLKTKFDGVDESILSRIAETKAAKAIKTEDDAKTFVEAFTLSQLLNSYGDIRSTEAQRTAITNYEKKHNLKDGKAVTGGDDHNAPDNSDDDTNTPAWAKQLIEDNKALRTRLDSIETEKRTTSRKEKLTAIIDKLPASQRKGYERTAIDTLSDEEFDTLLTEVGSEVDAIIKENKTNGTTFGTPIQRTQGGRSGETEKATKEEVDRVTAGW